METNLFHGDKSIFSALKPKTAFWLGFLSSFIVIFVVGFFILLVLFVQGMKNKGDSENSAEANVKVQPTAEANGPVGSSFPVFTGQISPVTESDHLRGEKNAKITIVEFSDFQCPYCSKFHPSMQQVVSAFKGKVNWVYRQFPLESIHPNARPAAEASECASEQGKFWEFADKLFANQTSLSVDFYKSAAKELGLNESQFNNCVDSKKYAQKVSDGINEASRAGARGTPFSVIIAGDKKFTIPGALSFSDIKAFLETL